MESDNDKKNKSMKEVFGEAMQYFGPGMIAALGTKDPKEIHNAYIRGVAAKQKDEELELNRQQQIESSRALSLSRLKPSYDVGFVDKSTGNVVKMDKSTGGVFNLDGTQVDPQNVEHEETYRQRNSINIRGEGLDIQRGRLDLDLTKSGQLTDTQVRSNAQSKEILRSISEIDNLQDGVNTGPIASKWNTFLAVIGQAPEDFNKMKVMVNAVKANFIQSISGTAVSGLERKDLTTVIPVMSDDDTTFADKLSQFKQLISIGGEEFLQAIATGQPLRADLARKLHNSLNKSLTAGVKLKSDTKFEEMLDRVMKKKYQEKMK